MWTSGTVHKSRQASTSDGLRSRSVEDWAHVGDATSAKFVLSSLYESDWHARSDTKSDSATYCFCRAQRCAHFIHNNNDTRE